MLKKQSRKQKGRVQSRKLDDLLIENVSVDREEVLKDFLEASSAVELMRFRWESVELLS